MADQISKSAGVLFVVLAIVGSFCRVDVSQAATGNSITRHGITWTFDHDYEYGQFANGDYWVVGPVTITAITPDYDGHSNGWQVNPLVSATHGFDDDCKNGGFDAGLVPSLPYTSTAPVESIVKIISSGIAQACIKTAAVLTVVPTTPENNGATVFRSPYAGTNKPFYLTTDLRTDLLPSYTSVGAPPALATVVNNFSYLRLEHLTTAARRDCRPQDAYGGVTLDGYNPEMQPGNHEALLRLMLNDPIQDKMAALVAVTQHGIDQAHIIIDGWETWLGDGHDPGHRIMADFAATMLDITAAKNELLSGTNFHEDHYVWAGQNGRSLWGEVSTELQYWNYVISQDGGRSNRDPYGFIDGGELAPVASYQNIVSQSWKATTLCAVLMPSLQNSWPEDKWSALQAYSQRWVSLGVWSQPDPCAPYSVGGTYGVDYGPDPANPGMCILDPDLAYYNSSTDFACSGGSQCGRFPASHGSTTDGGQYRSVFVADMWDAYYESANSDSIPPASPGALIVQ